MKNIGWVAVAAWMGTIVLAYVGLGGYLYEALEGMDRSMIPLAPPIAFMIFATVSIVLSILWARQLGSGGEPAAETQPSGRRKFLLGGAAVTGGVIGAGAATVARMSGWIQTTGPALRAATEKTAPGAHPDWTGATIVQKRPLGNPSGSGCRIN